MHRHLRSVLFIPTLRSAPSDAVVASHKLLVRGGFVRQHAAGVFSLLPLGTRVLGKVVAAIDDAMKAVGAQRMEVPCMQPDSLWRQSGRWDSTGAELFRFQDRHRRDWCLAPTAEEIFTSIVAADVLSYRQLPKTLYQVGRKFRDERRPRFGLLRGREFVMKDAYSFHQNESDALASYELMRSAYAEFFRTLCPEVRIVEVEADVGNIGGHRSHEFHVLSEIGEDVLLCCDAGNFAANSELLAGVADDACSSESCSCGMRGKLVARKGIEVAQTFALGTKYSEAFGAYAADVSGGTLPVHMGCYGVGITRIIAAAIEAPGGHDDKGIIWPVAMAPFGVVVIAVNEGLHCEAESVYDTLDSVGKLRGNVLLDDSTERFGAKLTEAELCGYPWIVIVGRSFTTERTVEVRSRKDGGIFFVDIEQLATFDFGESALPL